MGFSKLKIPKVCEMCGNAFEAKTITTRFCSRTCGNKADRIRTKQQKEEEQKQLLLQKHANKIAEVQTRPYISITEATVMFGISKDTLRRLIKSGKLPAGNLGQRLTRVSRIHLEQMFTAVPIPEKKQEEAIKLVYETSECYTINEVSEKFGVSLSTVDKTIRKYSIPKRQVGKHVHVPKEQIDKLFGKQQ